MKESFPQETRVQIALGLTRSFYRLQDPETLSTVLGKKSLKDNLVEDFFQILDLVDKECLTREENSNSSEKDPDTNVLNRVEVF